MSLSIYINNDTQDQPLNTSGVNWIQLSPANDYLIFSSGSDTVKDGEAIPSSDDLTQAGVVITTSKVIVPLYLLADVGSNELKEIHLAGDEENNGLNRYVFAFDFDVATASEPVLEVWDDEDMDSTDNYSLGEGTPSSSWIYGITTTDGAPAAGWTGDTPSVGSRLAGSSAGHFLYLNNENGALSGAKTLYAQLKIVVPANFANAGSNQPVFVVKYTSN